MPATRPLWTWQELLAAARPEAADATGPDITGVSIDTRTIAPGDLFVALKDQRDGHDFVGAAFAAGAAAALVTPSYAPLAGDGPLLRVPDTLSALEDIGRAARARLSQDARVVAVTGSAGKTGTKEMLRIALGGLGPTHASEKSYNNHWGVPLTLARMPAETRYAVIEIGMNHAGEIRPLTKMARPHAAIVTTVEAVHLEHFPSVEGIADAKSEIFEGLPPGGVAIIKHENPHSERLTAAARRCGARAVTFGFAPGAEVRGEGFLASDEGSQMQVGIGGRRLLLSLAMPGRHIAENALAVIAAADAVGADLDRVADALSKVAPPSGRGARTRLRMAGGEALLIDESYNANPASMRAALMTLAIVPRQKFGRRIAVLGDMLELGPQSALLHAGLKEAVDESGVDVVFACGSHMKSLYDALRPAQRGGYARDADELAPLLASALGPGDVLMVKASNGTRLGAVVQALKSRFG